MLKPFDHESFALFEDDESSSDHHAIPLKNVAR